MQTIEHKISSFNGGRGHAARKRRAVAELARVFTDLGLSRDAAKNAAEEKIGGAIEEVLNRPLGWFA